MPEAALPGLGSQPPSVKILVCASRASISSAVWVLGPLPEYFFLGADFALAAAEPGPSRKASSASARDLNDL